MPSLSFPLSRLLPAHLKSIKYGQQYQRLDDVEMQAGCNTTYVLSSSRGSLRPSDSDVVCPITWEPINPTDLHVTLGGISYSRAALKSWLQDPEHKLLPHNNCSAKEEIERLWPAEPGQKVSKFWSETSAFHVLCIGAGLVTAGALVAILVPVVCDSFANSSSITKQAIQQCLIDDDYGSQSSCVSTTEAQIVALNWNANHIAIPIGVFAAFLGAMACVAALVSLNRAKSPTANPRQLTAAEEAQLQSDLNG